MKLGVALSLCLLLAACVSSKGANPLVTDFDKGGLNYDRFPVERLSIGMPVAELQAMFGRTLVRVGSSSKGDAYVVERWVSVPGPDYVGERLFITVENGALASWRISSDQLTIN
jgi:hypothetical protein